MNYVSEVTRAFRGRTGEATILDAADYTRIAEWEKQEIPLFIVVSAIGKAFEERDENAGRIGSISELTEEVKVRYGAWLRTAQSC